MLTRKELEATGWIANAAEAGWREVGYDLRIGEIHLPPVRAGEAAELRSGTPAERELEPQGMAVVFSQESMKMPEDAVAIALPKSSLCERGILVLNTGVVDPHFEGPLSGTVINFSDRPIVLREGDAFLRLVFHRLSGQVDKPANALGRGRDVKLAYLATYPRTFLNVPHTAREVSDIIYKERMDRMLLWVVLFGFGIAIASAIFTFGFGALAVGADRLMPGASDDAKAPNHQAPAGYPDDRSASEEDQLARLRDLDQRVRALENEPAAGHNAEPR